MDFVNKMKQIFDGGEQFRAARYYFCLQFFKCYNSEVSGVLNMYF